MISPGYPNKNYPTYQNCERIVRFQRETPFRIEFLGEFELEASWDGSDCYDYVEIRNGENSNSPLIMKVCSDENLRATTLIGSSVWAKFQSDGGTTYKGFSLAITQLAQSDGNDMQIISYMIQKIYY